MLWLCSRRYQLLTDTGWPRNRWPPARVSFPPLLKPAWGVSPPIYRPQVTPFRNFNVCPKKWNQWPAAPAQVMLWFLSRPDCTTTKELYYYYRLYNQSLQPACDRGSTLVRPLSARGKGAPSIGYARHLKLRYFWSWRKL